ncbi:hypothetical protein RMSM_01771 [Rhodopirellula maiorica SM1]|uniref:Uncharacterized protein n=1 Tax=Rhodopirellula maiorica SM1 TaxID=1265738 RepID=M5RQ21_9BACT|nr:hypothetical protein RMSM_01771 [Rhodopirellula maiorica SM1]
MVSVKSGTRMWHAEFDSSRNATASILDSLWWHYFLGTSIE